MKSEDDKSNNIINDEKEKNDEEKDEENQILDKDNIKNSEIDDNEDFISHKKNFTPFKNDPYLDSNIISRFFVYWGYKVLKISKATKIKKEYLGKLNKKNDSRYFYDKLNSIWIDKGYRNISRHALLFCILRSNIFQLL